MGEFCYNIGQKVGPAPVIRKLGVLNLGMEQTPIVWHDRLMLVESIGVGHPDNDEGIPFFRVRDLGSNECSTRFGYNYYFSSGYTENGTVYVFGTSTLDNQPLSMYQSDDASTWHDPRGGSQVRMFWSDDLVTWQEKDIIDIPEWRLWNTSVCKGDKGYVMAIEVRQKGDDYDEVIGVPFTSFFAESDDLFTWKMMPADCCYIRSRYNACPALRYVDGKYYMICLEALPCMRYAPYIYRTKNFVDWQVGFHNPMMMWGDDDRRVKEGAILSPELLDLLEHGLNINCSDLDLCEYKGVTHIFYANGDQQTYSFLCEALYDGPMDEFLKSYFE